MMFLRNLYYELGDMLISLWPAPLFRDDQAAVVMGNGCPMGKLREKQARNFFDSPYNLHPHARLSGVFRLNFRVKIILFCAKKTARCGAGRIAGRWKLFVW
jgi:hypothetical protein